MTKLLSILMSGLILIQSFDIALSDIAKLDDLLEHAQFHAEKYGDNMLVFLSKHYGEQKEQHNKEHQEEEGDHEKLPFQYQCNSASVVAIVLNTSLAELISPQISEGWAANFYYQAPSSSLHAQGLFQPPKRHNSFPMGNGTNMHSVSKSIWF